MCACTQPPNSFNSSVLRISHSTLPVCLHAIQLDRTEALRKEIEVREREVSKAYGMVGDALSATHMDRHGLTLHTVLDAWIKGERGRKGGREGGTHVVCLYRSVQTCMFGCLSMILKLESSDNEVEGREIDSIRSHHITSHVL